MSETNANFKLSDRESEILLLAGDGLTDKEIANQLGVAVGTVSTYWERLRQKIGAANRAEAVAKALAESYREVIRELEEAHQWTRLFIHAASDYAIFMTDESGCLLDWNAGVTRVLGYSEEEFVGQNIEMLFTPADREMGAPQLERDQAFHHGRSLDERWHVRSDGTHVWVQGELHCLKQENHKVRFAKIMHDATMTRQLQDEVEKLREALKSPRHVTG